MNDDTADLARAPARMVAVPPLAALEGNQRHFLPLFRWNSLGSTSRVISSAGRVHHAVVVVLAGRPPSGRAPRRERHAETTPPGEGEIQNAALLSQCR